MSFNRFGAAAADLLPLYRGTVSNDFGGDTAINGALDRATDLILGSVSPAVYRAMTQPTLVRLVSRATASQTVLPAVPILPIQSNSLHVWVGYPNDFAERPRKLYDMTGSGLVELNAGEFTADLSTGIVTLTAGLYVDQQVFASYDTDTTSALYLLPSLARLAVRGAAAEMGALLYTQGTQEWALVDEYRTQFIDELARLRTGDSIPDEIRLAVWWQEVERTSQTVASVTLLRG